MKYYLEQEINNHTIDKNIFLITSLSILNLLVFVVFTYHMSLGYTVLSIGSILLSQVIVSYLILDTHDFIFMPIIIGTIPNTILFYIWYLFDFNPVVFSLVLWVLIIQTIILVALSSYIFFTVYAKYRKINYFICKLHGFSKQSLIKFKLDLRIFDGVSKKSLVKDNQLMIAGIVLEETINEINVSETHKGLKRLLISDLYASEKENVLSVITKQLETPKQEPEESPLNYGEIKQNVLKNMEKNKQLLKDIN